jgi:hypothetical protein
MTPRHDPLSTRDTHDGMPHSVREDHLSRIGEYVARKLLPTMLHQSPDRPVILSFGHLSLDDSGVTDASHGYRVPPRSVSPKDLYRDGAGRPSIYDPPRYSMEVGGGHASTRSSYFRSHSHHAQQRPPGKQYYAYSGTPVSGTRLSPDTSSRFTVPVSSVYERMQGRTAHDFSNDRTRERVHIVDRDTQTSPSTRATTTANSTRRRSPISTHLPTARSRPRPVSRDLGLDLDTDTDTEILDTGGSLEMGLCKGCSLRQPLANPYLRLCAQCEYFISSVSSISSTGRARQGPGFGGGGRQGRLPDMEGEYAYGSGNFQGVRYLAGRNNEGLWRKGWRESQREREWVGEMDRGGSTREWMGHRPQVRGAGMRFSGERTRTGYVGDGYYSDSGV